MLNFIRIFLLFWTKLVLEYIRGKKLTNLNDLEETYNLSLDELTFKNNTEQNLDIDKQQETILAYSK